MSDAVQPLKKLDLTELSCGRLFDEVPCYISIQAPDFNVIEANRKLLEDFGTPMGRRCYEVYKGRSETCPECPVARTLEDGKEHTSDEVIFDRRGLPHNVVVNTKPLRDREGKIVAVVEMFTDITVQKELEHRLHDSLHRFHHLFDAVPSYISVQDRDFTIIEANERFKETFGMAMGKQCYEAYKCRDSICPECPVKKSFEDGEVHHSEEMVTALDGRQLHVLTYAAPIRNTRGEVTSVMEVATDITEVKELQDKLAFIGQLVAGTAHSIKNVLEGLRGGVYVVNAGFRNEKEDDVKVGWDMVERNVSRVSDMIMDMLYCARDREPRRMDVSLINTVAEVLALFKQRATDVGVRLKSEIDPGLETITGDPKDIHALLANLITNAIDACAACEEEDKDYRVTVRAHREGDNAVLEVADNGIGMDADTRTKLFTMFFSTKGSKGTGLGLLVSHKVATEHGGAISVTSEPGAGATFTVTIPT
jgi:PAS domain S-box-containing protein